MSGRTVTIEETPVERAVTSLGVRVLQHASVASIGKALVVDRPFVIGREAGDADLAFPDDPGMSRAHCRLTPVPPAQGAGTPPALALADNRSKNGTYVNAVRQANATLHAGDVLRVGETLFEIDGIDDIAAGATPVPPNHGLVGSAPAFVACLEAVALAEKGRLPLLLYGETGTGKEELAKLSHALGQRTGPFVAVNCASVTDAAFDARFFGKDGAFAASRDGTLLLDEIGEMPLSHQAKFLRVLETGEVEPEEGGAAQKSNARVIASTCVDLAKAVHAGSFRRDLYARLIGVQVLLPPLRQRKRDILPLAEHFAKGATAGAALGPVRSWPVDLLERLVTYSWPLNLRELRTVVLHALAGGTVEGAREILSGLELGMAEQLPSDPAPAERTGERKPSVMSRARLVAVMSEHSGNIRRVAEALAIDRKQVYRWLERYHIDLEEFRRGSDEG